MPLFSRSARQLGYLRPDDLLEPVSYICGKVPFSQEYDLEAVEGLVKEIKAKLSCAELISRYTQLKRTGKGFSGRCPFPDHQDKSPSFYAEQLYYRCFGCGRKGDVIRFLQDYSGLSFKEALKQLCAEAGITLYRPKEPSSDLHRVLEETCLFYEEELEKRPDLQSYLRGRGLPSYKTFRVGYGASLPPLSMEMLEGAGLIRKGRHLFHQRITFPIFDGHRVCGFGGRALEGEPKYINSPQSEVFDKSRLLYRVPKPPQGRGGVFVVEGYTDVLALAEAGFYGAAPMGTSLTSQHLEQLWKVAPCLYLAFDGDAAGERATGRAIEMAFGHLSGKKTLKIVRLPRGKDPAQVVSEGGWKGLVENALDVIQVLWARLQAPPEARSAATEEIKRQISQINDREVRDNYYKMLRLQEPKKWSPSLRLAHPQDKLQYMFGLLYRHPHLCLRFQHELSVIDAGPYTDLQREALKIAEGEEAGEGWKRAEGWGRDLPDPERVWRDLFVALQGEKEKQKRKEAAERYLKNPTEKEWQEFLRWCKK